MTSKTLKSSSWIPVFTGMTMMVLVAAPFSADAAVRAYASAAPQGDLIIEMEAGQTKQVTLKFRNAGRYTWRGTGKAYASLYATGPYKRKSPFWHSDWISRFQAGRLREASVKPGETGTVTLTLHAPAEPGTYKEQFQLAVENTAWIYGSVARLAITVVPENVTASTPVDARAYAVMDPTTGEILLEKDADAVRSIASITKLMTIMTARETGLDPETVVALQHSDEVGGGRLKVPVGTKLSVRNLAAAAIVGSANNAANAVARATGLSKEEFVARMNAKAAAMGLASTVFADPTGLEAGNVSTAREIALLARATFADPWIAPYAAAPTYDVVTARGTRTIPNTNRLVRDGAVTVLAGKTGYIDEAGYTLVTGLKRPGGRDLLVVVLGSSTKSLSFRDAKALAERVWEKDAAFSVASR